MCFILIVLGDIGKFKMILNSLLRQNYRLEFAVYIRNEIATSGRKFFLM